MLVVTTVAEASFWIVAPFLAFPALLAGALVCGLFSLPVFSVIRQSVAAMVPAEQRRQAYALDSMSVELSFMAGPPLAVLLSSALSGRVAMWSIGGALVLAGIALYVVDPPVHTAPEPTAPGAAPAPPVRRRDWLTPRFVAVCAAASATTMVLAGTDLGIVAMLRGAGQVGLVGTLLAAWAVYSLIGGFIYGALPRAVPLVALLGALAVFTIPAGLVGGAWPLLFLTLLPAGALCAPTLSASADLVSRLVPSPARGEAMGWHGSSLTVGLAIGSPLAGWAIDRGSPAWGFATVGLVGAAAAAILLLFRHLDTPLPQDAADRTALIAAADGAAVPAVVDRPTGALTTANLIGAADAVIADASAAGASGGLAGAAADLSTAGGDFPSAVSGPAPAR
jgi:predicted MFS family arabinose efflux permease